MTQNNSLTNPYMALALEEAERAGARGEVPIGAVVLSSNREILAQAGNRMIELNDPTAHAEMLAIRAAAGKLCNQRLIGCSLYVTLEPCGMCAAAISFARIDKLFYGAADKKMGGVEHGVRFYASPACHHAPEIYPGIGEEAAARQLLDFFRSRREPR